MTDPIDLTGYWNRSTAAIIRDAWTTWRDGKDPAPIRQAYRDNAHDGLRAVLTSIMTAVRKVEE